MGLQRSLRGEDDACAGADVDRLREPIAAEDTGAAAGEDHVCRGVEIESPPDSKRRLGVGVREHGAAAPPLERELETRRATDRRGFSGIG